MASIRMMPCDVVIAHDEILGHPDVVHVVEDLRRLGVPRLARRWWRRASAATAATGSPGAAATRLTNGPCFGADAVEESRVFFPGRNLRGRDVFLHLRRRLGRRDRQSERTGNCNVASNLVTMSLLG